MLCEVARTPHAEGLLGELLHVLLTPRRILRSLPEHFRSVDYVRAQMDGALHGDCEEYTRQCDWPMFEVQYITQNVAFGAFLLLETSCTLLVGAIQDALLFTGSAACKR